MPKNNENEILRRLKFLSQLKPSSQATKRAIENVRQTLEISPKGEQTQHTKIWHVIIKSPISKLAAAAVIIIALGLSIVYLGTSKQDDTVKVAEATKSPAELTTFASLSFAYRRGGMKALEEVCDKAFRMAGPWPAKISIQELLEEFNGQDLERKTL